MFTNTSFFIITPENVYLDKNISILGGLEAEIFCFVTSGLQNIYLDIDIQNICGLEAGIKIIDTYHILGQPFCKIAAIKVIKIIYV